MVQRHRLFTSSPPGVLPASIWNDLAKNVSVRPDGARIADLALLKYTPEFEEMK